MASGRGKRDPVMGLIVFGVGVFLLMAGLVWSQGCDFDTMDTCKPMGVTTMSSFAATGVGGLLLVPGALLAVAGVAMTVFALVKPWR
jgi:hypothetical protein